ncbi:hypothetical protein GBAR_LOCUS4386, partial [Geodia barretti]
MQGGEKKVGWRKGGLHQGREKAGLQTYIPR